MTIGQPLTYQQVLLFARQLPLAERVQLVRDILTEPADEPGTPGLSPATVPLETLYGVFAGEGPVPSEDDIRATRREAWGYQ